MSNSGRRKLIILCCLAPACLVGFVLARRSKPDLAGAEQTRPPEAVFTDRLDAEHIGSGTSSGSAPFVVTDTATDSPGTNLVTRIATFKAEVSGSQPLFLQWKVDKGGGYGAVFTDATNSTLVISNARISDTGLYALFATNAAGGTHTTPIRFVVVEGVD